MKYIHCILLVCALAGCGTIIPGPRYNVNVSDYTFSYDGSAVFYLEDHYRFYPFLQRYREKGYLYLYDRAGRRHYYLEQTDAFSSSPYGPFILYAPRWEKRFMYPVKIPDFYLLNYHDGKRQECFLPSIFKRDYLSYGFARVRWEKGGALTVWVNFRYARGQKPSAWKRQRGKPPDYETGMWRVKIDPSAARGMVCDAVSCTQEDVPKLTWAQIRRGKFTGRDGASMLKFSKYEGYMTFNTMLAIMQESGEKEYIVKENIPWNYVRAVKYALDYISALPFFMANKLFKI